MPVSWKASAILDPPTMKLAARTTGIPANRRDLIVGPNFQFEKIIPAITEKIIAKNISGSAINGLIAFDI